MAFLPMLQFVVADEIDELMELERKKNLRREHKLLRDHSDPFNLPNRRFLKLFRLDKETVRFLINSIENHMVPVKKSWAVPNFLKVLVCLHFLGHGSYQLDVGGIYNFGISQPSVSRCIDLVTNLINTYLVDTWITFPTDEEHIVYKKEQFQRKYNFPNTLGAIDCTHIAIIAPPVNHPIYLAAPYFNRKGYYSINTQIICDANLTILNINGRYPGSVHDMAIWDSSTVKQHLYSMYLRDKLTYCLIGDSGYAVQPWLMTPVLNAAEGTPDALYNSRLISARNVIERLNGVLKSRFRCLQKHRTLNYNPIKAAAIIYSCAVLHNIAISRNVAMPHGYEFEIAENEEQINNIPEPARNDIMQRGQQTRNNFIRTYF